MDQRPSAKLISELYLLATLTLLHMQTIQSACRNRSLSSACVCLNDASCNDASFGQQTCLCSGGEDAPQAIVSEIEGNNGRIESLYISGHDVDSLDELIGSLDVVEHDLVIKGTSLMSLEPMDSVRSIGKLAIVENLILSNISGFGNLVTVTGDLLIRDNKMLEDISGFNGLTEVGGNLEIHINKMLTSISGFSELNKIRDGSLKIARSIALSEISGLSKLETIGGGITIRDNGKLVDISGLKELTEVSGDLVIRQNTMLQNLHGFGSKLRATGGLCVRKNDILRSLKGFQNLESIDGDLTLCNNPRFNVFGDTSNTLSLINGSLTIQGNHALKSLKGLENLTRVGKSLSIENNDGLGSLDGLGAGLKIVGRDLTIARNPNLGAVSTLEALTEVGHDVVIKGNDKSLDLRGLDNLKMVGGNLTLDVPFLSDRVLGKLERVSGDLHIIGAGVPNNLSRSGMGSLTSVGADMILENNKLHIENDFPSLTTIGGDLIIKGNTFEVKSILTSVETVEGRLEISSNNIVENRINLNILPNLQSLCGNASKGECSLQIRNNTGYKWIKGFQQLNNFNGSISIVRNIDLENIIGFNKLTSLAIAKPKSGLPNDGVVVDGVLGALIIGSNPKLTSIGGFRGLEEVEGNLFISGNPSLNQLVLENLERVVGLTQIFGNSENLPNITLTESLPYSEPGCRTRQNTIVSPNSNSKNQTMFVTKLEQNECVIEKLIPTLVGISIIAALVIVAFLLFCYMLSSKSSDEKDGNGNGMKRLREEFAMYVLAVADIFSDVGFTLNAFIVWQVKDPSERDAKLLVIGVLSVFVLVGVQVYSAVSVYIRLVKTICKKRSTLLQSLVSARQMKAADYFVLFPGLLFLEANVAKYLPLDSRNTADQKQDKDLYEYLDLIAWRAAMIEDVLQIVLQAAFIIVIEGDDGWAITAAIASLTLSVANLVVKTAFTFSSK